MQGSKSFAKCIPRFVISTLVIFTLLYLLLDTEARRKIRFVLAGATCAVLYYSALTFGVEAFGLHYLLSSLTAFFLSWGANFLLHKFWTFESKTWDGAWGEALKHGSMRVLMQIANSAGLHFLVEERGYHYLVAQLFLTVILTVIAYILSGRIFGKGVSRVKLGTLSV